ncbi:MAG: ABC transporter permease [Patescibacteria group bacterium]|nr:ABC transporter permease [Patescibacteria group bacterium]MCL5432143.1 ABC transporter permease [Patescibacteria group bacterium]
MNYFIFILKSAVFDFSRNKGRTFLTSLGILIGVFAVVLLVALGLGLKKYIDQQFQSLGSNLIMVMPGNVVSNGSFSGSAPIGISFDNKDVATLKRVPNVDAVLPFYVKFLTASANGNSKSLEMLGSTADVVTAMNLEIEYGEPFTKADFERGAKRVIIGPNVADKLYGSSPNAVGQPIKLSDQAYTVVGVTKSKGGGGIGGSSIDDRVFTSYTAMYSLNPGKKFYAIYLTVNSQDNLTQVKTDSRTALLKRYKPDDFSVVEASEFLSAINSIFGIINSILVAIAAISLLVGGIGIMNIMYVTVTERIREIGIRRAVGATRSDILTQFLVESVILSVFGGLAGLILAFLATLAVQSAFPAYIDTQSVALALGVSSAIGIIFGVLPARRAANLSPIEAIRYE